MPNSLQSVQEQTDTLAPTSTQLASMMRPKNSLVCTFFLTFIISVLLASPAQIFWPAFHYFSPSSSFSLSHTLPLPTDKKVGLSVAQTIQKARMDKQLTQKDLAQVSSHFRKLKRTSLVYLFPHPPVFSILSLLSHRKSTKRRTLCRTMKRAWASPTRPSSRRWSVSWVSSSAVPTLASRCPPEGRKSKGVLSAIPILVF